MVSEGKEQAIQHLSKADLALIGVLSNSHIDTTKTSKNAYQLTFENTTMVRGELNQSADGTPFEYVQSSKRVVFKTEGKNDDTLQAALEDDEVKEPQEGRTYVAILTAPDHIHVLVEMDPHDINEILRSAKDKSTVSV